MCVCCFWNGNTVHSGVEAVGQALPYTEGLNQYCHKGPHCLQTGNGGEGE